MRYLKSWTFDIGLGLLLAAMLAPFVHSETHVVSRPGALITASYTDYDLRFPLALALAGLAIIGRAVARLRPKTQTDPPPNQAQ